MGLLHIKKTGMPTANRPTLSHDGHRGAVLSQNRFYRNFRIVMCKPFFIKMDRKWALVDRGWPPEVAGHFLSISGRTRFVCKSVKNNRRTIMKRPEAQNRFVYWASIWTDGQRSLDLAGWLNAPNRAKMNSHDKKNVSVFSLGSYFSFPRTSLKVFFPHL